MSIMHLVANVTASPRQEVLEGQEYTVVPVVLIREGVLNGSSGPLFYPNEELQKAPMAWNSKPCIIYHPDHGTSANLPAVLNNKKVGLLLNVHFADSKLRGEAWLNNDRLASLAPEVRTMIDGGVPVEVSTGVYTENEMTPGEYNGIDYAGVARNYVPDHLAILPTGTGACSVADGAGLLLNARSYDNIREEVRARLAEEFENEFDFYIDALYPGFVIYTVDSVYYRRSYETDESGDVVLSGPPERVRPVTDYVRVDNSKDGDSEMKKDEIISALIANEKTHWSEADRDVLSAMDEQTLGKMAPVESASSTTTPTENQQPTTPAPPAQPAPVTNSQPTAPPTPLSLEDHLATLPPEMRSLVSNALKAENDAKAELVAKIVANERNVFTEDYLKGQSLDQLRGMAALIGDVPVANSQPTQMFIGQGPLREMTPTNNAAFDNEPLVVSDMFATE